MSADRKIPISKYIFVRFAGIILIMAVIMTIFISYFSDRASWLEIRRQIKRKTDVNFSSITVNNGKVTVDDNFSFDRDNFQRIILTDTGEIIKGSYPQEELSQYPVQKGKFQKVKCGSDSYYIFDRLIMKKDHVTGARQAIIIRGMGKASDFDSPYKTIKYISYIFIVVFVLAGLLLISVTSRRLSASIKQIQEATDKIGREDEPLKQKIEFHSRFTEIDNMIQANNRLIAQMDHLFEIQKQFTSDVAHELRTPISVVMAECQYVKKYGKTQEDYTEALDTIERQTGKTNQIIRQLLQLSRLDMGRIQKDFESADLREIAESVCDNEPLQAEKNITIRKNFSEAFALCNVALLSVAMKNLIDNACKYSEENSCIDVNLFTRIPETPKAGKEIGTEVVFQVRDYGCGMDQITLNHIFDRFYRADKARNSEGFGLGLPIVQKIVELHHGRLKVESEEGKGSTFTIYLNEV